MIEKSVLLDPAESVFGSHMELIQNGTIWGHLTKRK